MKNKTIRRILSLLLAIAVVMGMEFSSLAGAGIVLNPDTAAPQQSDSAIYAETLELSSRQLDALTFLESRESGILGFTGDYSLENFSDDEYITVIVEFNNAPAGVAALMAEMKGQRMSVSSASALAERDQTMFKAEIAKVAPSYQILQTYDEAINGAAVKVPASKVQELAELDSVRAVYPNTIVFAEEGTGGSLLQTMAAAASGNLRTMLDGSSSIVLADSREAMNVDKLHQEGITGEGVVVAVLDTGVDYNHPDLQDAFKTTLPANAAEDTKLTLFNGKYYGRNFITGTDLLGNAITVRDSGDPMETSYEEWLNYVGTRPSEEYSGKSYYTSHGTHVSGIVAAQGVNTPVSALGMAPGCQLLVYRVLGPYGAGSTNHILAAVNELGRDGVDVVNMSLGGSSNDPSAVDSIAINNMILQYDIVFCISAGNSGPNLATTTNPGSSSLAITVGAGTVEYKDYLLTTETGHTVRAFLKDYDSQMVVNADGTITSTYPLLQANEQNKYKFVPLNPDAQGVPTGTGTAADFAAAGNSVKGNIVVVVRGNTFLDTIANAIDAGAGGVLLINDAQGDPSTIDYRGVSHNYLPMWTVLNYADGVELMSQLKAMGYLASFTGRESLPVAVGEFSSRGPIDVTMDIKPDIIAHGQGVLSLCPWYVLDSSNTGSDKYEYAYVAQNGTSMSSPGLAGIAALLRGYSNDNDLNWSTEEIKARLMNTATPITSSDYSVYEQGAGYVNAYRALHTDLYATTPYDGVIINSTGTTTSGTLASLNFGPADVTEQSFSKTLQVEFHNTSGAPKTITVSHEFTQAGQGVLFLPEATLAHDTQVTIPAGQSVMIDVTLSIPVTATKGSVEGYLIWQDGSETYSMPFASRLPRPRALIDSYFGRPMVASINGGYRQISNKDNNSSDRSDCYLEWAGSNAGEFTVMYYYVRNAEGDYIGMLDPYMLLSNGLPAETYRLDELYTGTYLPLDEAGNLSGRAVAFTEGLYYIECRAYAAESGYDSVIMPLYVDDTPPELKVDNADGKRIYYTGDSVTITGNVYDFGAEVMEQNGIRSPATGTTYSQSSNGLVIVYGNSADRVIAEENGDFTYAVKNLSGVMKIDFYVLDGFVPSVIPVGSPFTKGFDETVPSFSFDKGGLKYAYYGANIAKHTFTAAPVGTPEVKIINVSVTPNNLIETLTGAIDIKVEGLSLDKVTAYLKIGYRSMYQTEIVNGAGRMLIDKVPAAGTYELVVEVESQYGDDSYTSTVTVLPYKRDIWAFTPEVGSDGYLYLQFETKVQTTANTVLTIGGVRYSIVGTQEINGRGTRLKTNKLASECKSLTKITVNNVALPSLYHEKIMFSFNNNYIPQ